MIYTLNYSTEKAFRESLIIRSKLRTVRPLELKAEKIMARFWNKQARSFLSRFEIFRPLFPGKLTESRRLASGIISEAALTIRESLSQGDWEAVWQQTVQDTAGDLEALDAIREQAMKSGASDAQKDFRSDPVIGAFRLSFSVDHPAAISYFSAHGLEHLRSELNRTTFRQMKTTIDDAIRRGRAYDDLAREINARFDGFSGPARQRHIRNRAELVAITEIGQAYETGGFATYRDIESFGIVLEKSWINTGDDRVSEGCLANTSDGWIGLEDNFDSGDPHPLRFPGCRCALDTRRKR